MGSTSIRHRSDTFVWDRYQTDIDPRVFASWACCIYCLDNYVTAWNIFCEKYQLSFDINTPGKTLWILTSFINIKMCFKKVLIVLARGLYKGVYLILVFRMKWLYLHHCVNGSHLRHLWSRLYKTNKLLPKCGIFIYIYMCVYIYIWNYTFYIANWLLDLSVLFSK